MDRTQREEKAKKTEFVEGLTIQCGTYQLHPRLAAFGHSGVPTFIHPETKTAVSRSTDCIEFTLIIIDHILGCCLLTKTCWNEPKDVNACSIRSLYSNSIPCCCNKKKPSGCCHNPSKVSCKTTRVPFFLELNFSIDDISIAPCFDRMFALKHYRDSFVPAEIKKWHVGSAYVLERECDTYTSK